MDRNNVEKEPKEEKHVPGLNQKHTNSKFRTTRLLCETVGVPIEIMGDTEM